MHVLQLIETLRSVTNGPFSDISDILNKYFAGSTWAILTFPSFNAIFENREPASRISIGTCCQIWLAHYGIGSSPYFSEQGFSVWKM